MSFAVACVGVCHPEETAETALCNLAGVWPCKRVAIRVNVRQTKVDESVRVAESVAESG